jgi:hypothetical protein
MSLTAMVIPDLQIPLHDRKFLEVILKLVRDVQPDILGFIGDLSDSTEVSHWAKGKPGEYTGQFQNAMDFISNTVRRCREAAPKAEMWLQSSNHDIRIREYLLKGAPALIGQRSLQIEHLMGLKDNGVIFHEKPHSFLPGVVSVHGHEETYSSVPGKYGLDAIDRYGCSVVYGHTHRPVLMTNSRGYDGVLETQFAMNVGHGMDTLQVDYTQSGHVNWCKAIGLVHYDNGTLYPELLISLDGSIRYEGKIYK